MFFTDDNAVASFVGKLGIKPSEIDRVTRFLNKNIQEIKSWSTPARVDSEDYVLLWFPPKNRDYKQGGPRGVVHVMKPCGWLFIEGDILVTKQ